MWVVAKIGLLQPLCLRRVGWLESLLMSWSGVCVLFMTPQLPVREWDRQNRALYLSHGGGGGPRGRGQKLSEPLAISLWYTQTGKCEENNFFWHWNEWKSPNRKWLYETQLMGYRGPGFDHLIEVELYEALWFQLFQGHTYCTVKHTRWYYGVGYGYFLGGVI